MTDYEKVKATLDSPGMVLIVAELKRKHRKAYAEYRTCGTLEQVFYLQTLQKVIDTALPEILTTLMNKHVEPKTPPKSPEWWHFKEWLKSFSK